MRINLHIPAHLVSFVNEQRGAMSVQTFLIEQVAKMKQQQIELLSQNYEDHNDQEECPQQ